MLGQGERPASPRQFKVPMPTAHARRKRAPRKGSHLQGPNGSKQKDPYASLPKSPQPKAVAPYVPKSEGEDVNLRFLIHHCGFL
jgi:hypothetical protein